MGRNAQPVALLKAKGRTVRPRAYWEEREAREVKVPFDQVSPPDYLKGKKNRAEFMEIAGKLKAIGIFTELDEDVLARYILSKNLYLLYTQKLTQEIAKGDTDTITKYQRLQAEAFKQCRACGSDLGLSITSRCKIQIPQVDSEEDFEL